MEDSMRHCVPSIESANDFLETIEKKYKKFSKNEYLDILHFTIYDGIGGIRAYIDKLMTKKMESK